MTLQKRYQGFLKTPFLWKEKPIYNLSPFYIAPKFTKITQEIDENQRLGKYVEQLVFYQLSQNKKIKILAENIQIQRSKLTLGEIDCLIENEEINIHLEIVYKFYLYDEQTGTDELTHFIGPNRKDSLIEKLEKLSTKQLPILFSQEARNNLIEKGIEINNISQQVYFKAQLFIPYGSEGVALKQLNNDCIVGFYIQFSQLSLFEDCKFFIPTKKDWLLQPFPQVKWIDYNHFKERAIDYMERKYAPLCWLKSKNGEMHKFFLVWWSFQN